MLATLPTPNEAVWAPTFALGVPAVRCNEPPEALSAALGRLYGR